MSRPSDNPFGEPNLGGSSAKDYSGLAQHIGEWWGEGILIQDTNEFMPIDVLVIPASSDRPHHTLVTLGMSDRPMAVADGLEAYRYAELLLALPATWPLDPKSLADERYFWPIRQLRQTARVPHQFQTWMWFGHTIAHGHDLAPVHEDAPFVGFTLSLPFLSGDGARKRRIRAGKDVHFFALLPLYRSELEFASRQGAQELLRRLYDTGVTELVRVGRTCAITGRVPERVPLPRPVALPEPRLSLGERFQRWWYKKQE